MTDANTFDRRTLMRFSAAGLFGAAIAGDVPAQQTPSDKAGRENSEKGKSTQFQIACMTLPYSQYPLERALSGIKSAGFKYVAWGTSHRESGETKPVPVMPADAPVEKARDLGQRCRDMGLAPLMMFSIVYPEHQTGMEVLTHRIRQAQAAGMPHVLTFGHSEQNRKLWVERFKKLGPIARDHGVVIVVKQHGETGQVTGEIVREVDDEGIRVNYDAGNVMDYTKGKVNPLDDIKTCDGLIHSFCIKDHRLFPVDQDCGPGLGEIDHYRLLHNVAFAGRPMPLCCENISVPKVRPTTAEEVDANARRSREFLELVIRGLQA